MAACKACACLAVVAQPESCMSGSCCTTTTSRVRQSPSGPSNTKTLHTVWWHHTTTHLQHAMNFHHLTQIDTSQGYQGNHHHSFSWRGLRHWALKTILLLYLCSTMCSGPLQPFAECPHHQSNHSHTTIPSLTADTCECTLTAYRRLKYNHRVSTSTNQIHWRVCLSPHLSTHRRLT